MKPAAPYEGEKKALAVTPPTPGLDGTGSESPVPNFENY